MSGTKQDLNDATRSDLLKVDQIGQVLADRLLTTRPFKNWDAVKAVPQIGPKRLANLQNKFCIGHSAQRQAETAPPQERPIDDWISQQEKVNDWTYVPCSRVVQKVGESTTFQPNKQQLCAQGSKATMNLNISTKEQLMQAKFEPASATDLINADWTYLPCSRVAQNGGELTTYQPIKQQPGAQGSKATMNLNIATKEQLMQANQIGHAFATNLINARPFRSWDEVAKLYGIGKVRLTSLQSLFHLSEEVRKASVSDQAQHDPTGPHIPGEDLRNDSANFGPVTPLGGSHPQQFSNTPGDSSLDCAASAISELSFATASSDVSMLSAEGLRCFLPHTVLPCSLGNYQSVESFQVGDMVLSAARRSLTITSLTVHEEASQKCVELCAGDVTNTFTESHRVSILRAGRRQAVPAGTLRRGDDVFMSAGGTQPLSAVNFVTKECAVYEFTLQPDDPIESYLMLPGAILTHGRGPRHSNHRGYFRGVRACSIPDTDSERAFAR